jgi:hypothetical protein
MMEMVNFSHLSVSIFIILIILAVIYKGTEMDNSIMKAAATVFNKNMP